MPLNFAKLAATTASATIDFGDGNVLNVEYYPQRITSQMLLDIAALGESAGDVAGITRAVSTPATILASVLHSWDAVEEDAESGNETPLPLDRDHLLALSIGVQWAILNTLIQAQAGEVSAPMASAKA